MKKGVEYQDFICVELHKRGIVLQNFSTPDYQYKKENLLGLEIKFDDLLERTGRIYIETAEKAEPREGQYAPAGIYRNDESWLYGIGNYSIFFIFDKNGLRRLDKNNPEWLYRPSRDKETSQGFCIPIDKAKIIAANIIYFQNTGKDKN